METFKIGICEPEGFSEQAIDQLKQIGNVECFREKDLKKFISDKNAIFVRLKYQITDELIEECSDLRYICSPTTGLNHISITNSSIHIVSLKGEQEFLTSIRATPEHVFGLSIALLRNYAHCFLNEKQSMWNRNFYKGYELYNNNIGIIGAGRIGKLLIHYYQAFGANVAYYEIKDEKIPNATKCDSLNELIQKSDILILETNYIKENENMIGKHELDLMKGKYFINAARGELVDEEYLIELIEKNYFKGVAIDVIQNETDNHNNLTKYLKAAKGRNIIITPHIGGATYSSMERTEEFIAEKLMKFMKI